MLHGLLNTMSGANEASLFLCDDARLRIVRAVVEAFYCATDGAGATVFDNSRSWLAIVGTMASLFPESRMICCIRNPAWILDSVERFMQRNSHRPSKIFNYEAGGSVYGRTRVLVEDRMVGPSLQTLRTAWYGEYADKLIAVPYTSLTERLREVWGRLGPRNAMTPGSMPAPAEGIPVAMPTSRS
jgi:sulfotransferase